MSTQQRQPAPAKPPLTHFLCLPLVNAESAKPLQESLDRFRHDVQDSELFSSQAIRPLNTLHLTLGVMSLDEDQLQEVKQVLDEIDAASVLKDVSGDSAGNDPVQIRLQGLGAFRQPTSVLYGSPHDETERLYPFCLAVRDKFRKFLIDENRDLTLHATIVNTIYAKNARVRGRGRGGITGGRGGARSSRFQSRFDAHALLEQFRDFQWASNITLDRLCLCEMGAKKTVDETGKVVDERYKEVAATRLPT